MSQSNLAHAATESVASPFVSDPDAGIYFWSHGTADDGRVQYSNRPHPLLPHRCDVHDWYSDAPCQACDAGPYVPGRPVTYAQMAAEDAAPWVQREFADVAVEGVMLW